MKNSIASSNSKVQLSTLQKRHLLPFLLQLITVQTQGSENSLLYSFRGNPLQPVQSRKRVVVLTQGDFTLCGKATAIYQENGYGKGTWLI